MVCDKVSPGDRQDSNPNIDFVECDVSNKESFANAFKVTKERFGKLDVVINNAGVLMEARYEGNHMLCILTTERVLRTPFAG